MCPFRLRLQFDRILCLFSLLVPGMVTMDIISLQGCNLAFSMLSGRFTCGFHLKVPLGRERNFLFSEEMTMSINLFEIKFMFD